MYHLPVLAEEAIARLVTRADGKYLDGTVGGGGHLTVLLQALGENGRVLGIDRDPDAIKEAETRTAGDGRVQLRRGEFGDLARHVAEEGMLPLDGILLDLGVSSHQLDDPGRGFTYREDAPLDMRMDPDLEVSAADLLAVAERDVLERIFREYGELSDARALAQAVVEARVDAPITQSGQLKEIVAERTPAHMRAKRLSQLFQALRIEVNDELGQLHSALEASVDVLRTGGRLVTIAYHSLEDRMVKVFLRNRSGECTCPPGLPVCACGACEELRLLTRRAVKASQEEVAENPRARSARLRAAERTEEDWES